MNSFEYFDIWQQFLKKCLHSLKICQSGWLGSVKYSRELCSSHSFVKFWNWRSIKTLNAKSGSKLWKAWEMSYQHGYQKYSRLTHTSCGWTYVKLNFADKLKTEIYANTTKKKFWSRTTNILDFKSETLYA